MSIWSTPTFSEVMHTHAQSRFDLSSSYPGYQHRGSMILSCVRFGVLFNIARLTVDDVRAGFSKGPWWYRLFNGYDIVTWLVVLNLGCTGLLVSWVMKYADNIVKVFLLSSLFSIKLICEWQSKCCFYHSADGKITLRRFKMSLI